MIEDALRSMTTDLLIAEGYKLVEDAWDEFGRYTYLHDDDADRNYLKALAATLKRANWQQDSRKLRTFRHPNCSYEIEVEPGGSEVSGHFVHLMKLNRS
jgi:hypothetical protein